ncbi:MAG: D-glycerate dehydrogenase [Verrucomicrobiales bacterium]|nr:D-glycerate dehydrogenase [Verrucomicrobiales bacterium]
MLPKILVTLGVPEEHLAPLAGIAELHILDHGVNAAPRETVLKAIRGCTGVISQGELRVDDELLDAAGHSLKMVANAAMGIDNLDLVALGKRGITASNTPDAFAESTADHTFGLLLALTRRIAEGDRFVRSGAWAETKMQPLRWEGSLAGGKTLGIIGYGRIAKLVETRAKAFNLDVIYTRTQPDRSDQYRSLGDLLAQSDIVLALVPHTPSTHHLIDRDALQQMKPGAIFINVARGKVMDEAAVVDALRSGHLGGAALDVFEEEPVVNPAFFEMNNVVLTPHTGGATAEERKRGRMEAAENVARFLKGEPLLHPVNLPT